MTLDRWHRDAVTADQSQRIKPKREPPALKPITIIVDTREQNMWAFSQAVTVEFATLTEGDYSLKGFTERVRVERKSLDDLVGSITVGRERFMDECKRLMSYEFRALVIEATMRDVIDHRYQSRTIPKSVLASVFAIHIDYNLPAIWTVNAKGGAAYTEWIFRRIQAKWEPKK